MKWYLKVLRQYADFSGRAGRTEYWMFVLFHLLFTFVFTSLFLVGLFSIDLSLIGIPYVPERIGEIVFLYIISMTIPALAVTVRRLHDIGMSGWMVLTFLIPIVGWLWLLVLLTAQSQTEENGYGINPQTLFPEKINKRKNAGNALIIASALSLLVNAVQEIFIIHYFRYVDASFNFDINFIIHELYIFYPVILLVLGISLVKSKQISSSIAQFLIIASVLWMLPSVYTLLSSIKTETGYMHISFYVSVVIQLLPPISLLTVGIAWLEKQNIKVATVFLMIASILWMFNYVYGANDSNFLYQGNSYLWSAFFFFFYQWTILMPVSLLVLACSESK